MSILSDSAIMSAMARTTVADRPVIHIQPFFSGDLGGNSYDVHLARRMLVYRKVVNVVHNSKEEAFALLFGANGREDLDVKAAEETDEIIIPEEGYVLEPGILYLAVTAEYTETHEHVPYLDGKSSIGRLGIFIHTTAGRGDVGFCGHWTMEISVVHPVRVYAGMPIGQLTFHSVEGNVRSVYRTKPSAKYTTETGWSADPRPTPSAMYRNF